MIKNYLKIAYRNLKKNKGFTVLNITGLSIGIAVAMLIFLWVNSELTYDRFYTDSDQIYVVGNRDAWEGETVQHYFTPKPMAAALKTDFPEINTISRVNKGTGFLLTYGDIKLSKEYGSFVDSTFLKIFDFKVLAGNANESLKNPNQIVLTKSLAERLFGKENPINQTIKADLNNVLTVSAIIEDMPENSFMNKMTYLVSWTLMEKLGYSDEYWTNNSIQTYIKLDKDINIDQFKKNIKGFLKKHTDTHVENFVEPMSDIWLYSTFTEMGRPTSGRIGIVQSFIAVACFILIIACINFMNLSTAQSEKRATEVGVRKVVGANKSKLISQFLTESLLITFIAGIFSIFITVLALPAFNELISRQLNLPYNEILFWVIFIGFLLLTGLLAGSYPAFYLSSFIPIKVLKGKLVNNRQKFNSRKILVVSQFCIAIILMITTITIQKQIKYAQNREIGYNKNRLISIMDQGDIRKNKNLIKNALINNGIASNVSRTSSPLTENWSYNPMEWEGKSKENRTIFARLGVDDNLVKTAGLQLLAGRDFDLSKFPTDSSAMIINEAAAKVFNFDNPIGKTIVDGRDWHIIAVVKDFVQESPFNPVTPLVIQGAHAGTSVTNIRINDSIEIYDALNHIEKIFKEYNSEYPFEYSFVDTVYAEKFKDFQQIGKLSSLFAILTIFISCLGLFGLTAYMAENRTKEIGVRKVLGASILSITNMLSKEFIFLVLIACIISFPIAYYISDTFLSTYSYRIKITWDIFFLAALGAILVTLLTVSYQSIKAALANPVDSLRDE